MAEELVLLMVDGAGDTAVRTVELAITEMLELCDRDTCMVEELERLAEDVTSDVKRSRDDPLPLPSSGQSMLVGHGWLLLLDSPSPRVTQSKDSSRIPVNIFVDFRCIPTGDLAYETHVGCLCVSSYRRAAPTRLEITPTKVFFSLPCLLPRQRDYSQLRNRTANAIRPSTNCLLSQIVNAALIELALISGRSKLANILTERNLRSIWVNESN